MKFPATGENAVVWPGLQLQHPPRHSPAFGVNATRFNKTLEIFIIYCQAPAAALRARVEACADKFNLLVEF